MLSDKEVMNAAEAITRAYLTSLFSPPPTGARARTSQKHSFHFLSLTVQRQQVPLLPHGTAVGDEMQTLRGRCSELLRYDAQALHVLCCVVNMVQEGLLCTERDVYYRNTELFPNGQRDTHCSIERLCRWMSCVCPLPPGSSAGERRRYTREDLRIGASGKSILLGNLAFDIPTVSATSTSLVSGGAQELPTCVPSAKVPSVEVNAKHHISGVLVSTTLGLHAHNFRAAGAGRGNGVTAALVVVEKESTLHTLADVKSALGSESISNRCAYLCSKGYPCRASRLFLRSLHRELPELPILVLVDGDPHGLRIALTFMGLFGEDINRGRRCQPAERVPELSTSVAAALLPIRWVGVRPSCLSHDNKGRAPLTEHDKRVLKQVIQRAKAALEGLPGTGSSFPLGQYCVGGGSAEDIIRVTLDEMLREAEWMQMMETKCCLQAYVEGPLRLIIDFLHSFGVTNRLVSQQKVSAAQGRVMSRATYSRSTSPYRSPRGGTPSRSTDASAFIRFLLSENIDQRIADTKRWLRRIREHMRNNAPRRCSRCFDPSMIFCAIRASSALLTEKPNRHRMSARPRRFRCSLNSFLDGTPFLTPRDLCRYNTSVAKRLSDDELELMRKYVFDYDEVAFADLLYGDDIIPDDSEEGRDESPRSRRRILAAVRAFNERSRIAMERLFAAPGGLVDAVMRITLLVPLVSNDMDDSDEG